MRTNFLKSKLLSFFLVGILAVTTISTVPSVELYAEEGEERVSAKRSFDSNYDLQNAYSGNDLGCTYTPEKTTFKVWSPEASSVVLCRYEKGDGGRVIGEAPMTKGDKGVWTAEVTGDIVNTYYTYKVTVNGTTEEAVDIYAKAAGVNGSRAMVVDLDSTDPEHWDKNYRREETLLSDIIVWEIHIRDFSVDASSGVSQQNRGKYKAFTERTTINGERRTASCVDYLKELGVTHVQILPMYDYASVDETNVSISPDNGYSWGYDPKNYNVPEGSYSSNPYDGNVRITEMKEMIQALHDAGIKVIMDVSYSYTYDAGDSNFNKIMPDYYYKLNSDLSYKDQSGYGNATRSDSAMFRKFMIDSVSYWAEEYNLDGFRFDLMGIHDVTTMNQIRSTLNKKFGENTIVLYGEGITGNGAYDSYSAHKANESKLDMGIGYYNEQLTEALQGRQKFDGTIGLVQTNYFMGEYLEPNVKWPNNIFGGIMGSAGYTSGEWGMWRPFWSKSTNCCLSYVSAHGGLTLWDKLTEGFGQDFSSVDDKMKRMNQMAGSVVLVSKGGAFMQAGEEFARTKNGDDNSCSSPDSVNKIDWNRVNTYSDIQEYYKGMIRIRKAFSGFRSILERAFDNWEPANNNIQWISKEEAGMIAFYETNNTPYEWDGAAVLINNAVSDQIVNLTDYSDNWVIIADGTTAGLEKIRESGPEIIVPGKSVMVAVPKDTFDKNHVSKNEPPVLTCDSSFQVLAGEPLLFTVETTDPDKDPVTLKADGIPNEASFDTATGMFQWEHPTAGEYTVTLTASDGRTAVTKNVTITVIEKTSELKNLIWQIEEKNYQKKDFTEEVYQVFENALANAKETAERNETDDAKIQAAFQSLTEAYQNINKEAAAKEEFIGALEKAATKLEDVQKDPLNYEAEAVADLKTVISDAEEFMKSVHSEEEYQSKEEDLEYAVKACTYKQENEGGVFKSDKAALREQIAKAENVIKENPGNENLAALKKTYDEAKNINENSDASQVDINKAVRALKKYIRAVLEESDEGPTEPGDDPTNPGEDPSNPGEDPSDPGEDPTNPDGPGEDPSNPGGGPSDPGEDPSNPGEDPSNPGEGPSDPGEDPSNPGEDPSDPGEGPSNPGGPGEEPSNPGEGPSAPGEDPSNPGEGPGNPGEGPSNPGEGPGTPGEDPSNPGGNPSKPGQIPTEPGEDPVIREPVSKLKIKNLTIGKASGTAQVGDNILITVKSAGGTGSIQYRFVVKKGSSTVIRNYSTSRSAKWKPKKAGKYSIIVYAKDSEGKTAKKTISKYVVKGKLKISSFKVSPSSKKVRAGKKIKLAAKASGGTKKYQYKFAYKKSGMNKQKVIRNYSSKKTVNYVPKVPGTYKLYVYARDKTTKRVAKKIIGKYIVK